jgi:hypothetical protein
VPLTIPVTIPVDVPMVAVAIELLDHVPPAVRSVRVVVNPWHTVVVPVIFEMGLTNILIVAIQPVL